MSVDSSALVIAVVGVLGTLSAPVVSQRLSARARRDDFELQWTHDQRRAALDLKRSCYVTLTATSRRYRVELRDYLHMLERGNVDITSRSELQETRRGFVASLAEAQMIAPGKTVIEIEEFAKGMSSAYRRIKNLEAGRPQPEGSFEEADAFLVEVWGRWEVMRDAMRGDLGIEGQSD